MLYADFNHRPASLTPAQDLAYGDGYAYAMEGHDKPKGKAFWGSMDKQRREWWSIGFNRGQVVLAEAN